MKRMRFWLALAALLPALSASAQVPVAPRQVAPPPPSTQRPMLQRYRVSSFGVWVRTNAPGYPAYRYTYQGQQQGSIPPAIFTYGYEHTMQENGPNTLNGPWH